MRTWLVLLVGLFITSSSFAEEGQKEGTVDRPRIGVVIIETSPEVKIADDFGEVLIAYLGKEAGGGAELVGPEELRLEIAPAATRADQNADIQRCLSDPVCVTRTIVQMDLALFGAGFIGQTGKKEYRVQLMFYDVYGRELVRDDFKLRGNTDEVMQGAFPSVAKALQSNTATFEFQQEPGVVFFLNDKTVRGARVVFLKPDIYQVRVERSNCRLSAQTFTMKAGMVLKVAPGPCDPWIPVKAAELRDQCLHYTRFSPPNWAAARPKCEEALAAGGREDPKLLLTLARIAHEELELEKSFDYAERATQVTARPSAKGDMKAAEKFTADVLRKRYGPVIIKLDEAAKATRGYIHLREKGGLINPDKKRVFSAIQARLSAKEIELDRSGTMFYLPFGTYKANAVPFTVDPGQTPEVEIIMEATPHLPASVQPEKGGVPLSVWAVTGVGAATLMTGVAVHMSAFGKVDEYMAATTQEDADRARRDGERLQIIAGGLYGLTAAAAGAAFLLYSWTTPAEESAVRVTPMLGGVVASVSF